MRKASLRPQRFWLPPCHRILIEPFGPGWQVYQTMLPQELEDKPFYIGPYGAIELVWTPLEPIYKGSSKK